MSEQRAADVAPAVPLAADGRQAYTYRLPTGTRDLPRYASVIVPFGRRAVTGVVMRVFVARRPERLLAVRKRMPAVLTSEQVALARWVAEVSHGGLGYTLRLFLPDLPSAPPRSHGAKPAVLTSRPVPRHLAIIDHDLKRRSARVAVYIRNNLAAGLQVAVIVPERWMVEPLRDVLQSLVPARYALLHTRMPLRQRADLWHRVRAGALDVVIGTQKVLWLPWRSLGLLVIEEESLAAHKAWDQYPRMHTMYAAQALAGLHGASLIYTSAFPSLWLAHTVAQSHLAAVSNRPLALRVAIMPFALADAVERRPLPRTLFSQLQQWAAHHEQVLLFYNRRRTDFIEAMLHQAGLPAKAQLLLATSAIFTSRAGQTFDRIVWLLPETYLSYPDWRGPEQILLTAARLQQLLKPRRRLIVVTRRQPVAALFARPLATVREELLDERRRLKYPPFVDLVRLSVAGRSVAEAWQRGVAVRRRLDAHAKRSNDPVKIRGPFHDGAKLPRRAAAVHLLLAGSLPNLIALYDKLPIATAEVAPHRLM